MRAPRRPRPLLRILFLALVLAGSVLVPVVRGLLQRTDPCEEAKAIVDSAPTYGDASKRPLADALPRSVGQEWVPDASHSQDLEVASEGHGGRWNTQQWWQKLADLGFRRGWRRTWLLAGEPLGSNAVLADVLEFVRPARAREFQAWAVSQWCGSAKTFSVPGLPGAVGLRVQFQPDWTTDHVTFVVGDRRYLLVLGTEDGSPDRDALFRMVSHTFSTATRSGDAPCSVARKYVVDAIHWSNRWSGKPMRDLERLLPAEAPRGFGLEGPIPIRPPPPGVDPSRHVQRTWFDGFARIGEEVLQFESRREAHRWLQAVSRETCPDASLVSEEPLIDGSVLILFQESEVLHNLVFFARGSRGYRIEFVGPARETPGETLQAFARRAQALAR